MSMTEICMLALMFIISAYDVVNKKIPVMLIVPVALLAVTFLISERSYDLSLHILGMLPGFVFLLVGHFTKLIGEGDGVLLILTGIMTGYSASINMLLWASVLVFIVSLPIVIVNKVRNIHLVNVRVNADIPFIPFMTVGYLIVFLSR